MMTNSQGFKVIAKALMKLFGSRLGQKRHQEFFEQLHRISLQGMNIGDGDNTETSGERAAVNYIKTQLTGLRKAIIFDVGANIGNYSILLHDVFGEQARIFSFEPSLKTYRKLVLNTEHLSDIKRFNFGFGDTETTLTLYSDADESGLASVYNRKLDYYDIYLDVKEEITIKTIDTFCASSNIKHIHFLKLDVEGHELNVLKGASGIIECGYIDYIQFEFGGCNIDSRTYFKDFFYLLKGNYTIYRIIKDGLHQIDEYTEFHELFTTTNFLAERIDR